MEIMNRNLTKIMIFIGVLIFALVLRLAYIQLLGHDELSAAVRAQSLISLEGSNTRGMIYDRNGAALVADDKQYVYIIREDEFDVSAEKLLDQADAEEVSGSSEGYRVYSSENYEKSIGEKLISSNHAYILQASSRYSEDQAAEHLIGYVNREDQSGAAGLEMMYDEILSGYNRRIYAAADVKGNILPGRGLIIASDKETDSYIKSGIRTTLDKEIQQEVEKILDDAGGFCAAVVLDVNTGGVTAMASAPGFDPDDIESYIGSSGDELVNRATQGQYAPGSVFKIAAAAAALERGIGTDKTFVCSGDTHVGSLSIGCETGGEEGHGTISFREAFAVSCNSFFIQLGQEIGAGSIIETAEEMGLGAEVIEGFPQENSGHLMTAQERFGEGIGNLCIGQGELLVTPVQIAAMTAVIASGGIDHGVHLLMADEPEESRVISGSAAAEIQQMMEGVTIYGTAAVLGMIDENGEPEAAVKTGTAEYGSVENGGTHGWITGYAPCQEPEYVITVLVEDGSSGSAAAGPVFKKIVEYLKKSGSYGNPTLA